MADRNNNAFQIRKYYTIIVVLNYYAVFTNYIICNEFIRSPFLWLHLTLRQKQTAKPKGKFGDERHSNQSKHGRAI